MICAIFMTCIPLLSVTFVMYFKGRNKDIYYYYYYYYYYQEPIKHLLVCFNWVVNILCTYQCKAAGRGGGECRAWCGDLIVFVGPGVGHLTNLVLPGVGMFISFFARHGTNVGMDLTAVSDERDWDRTYVSPLPRFTHVTYGLERSRNHGSQGERAKGEWILLYWSIEPFKILWYESKRK